MFGCDCRSITHSSQPLQDVNCALRSTEGEVLQHTTDLFCSLGSDFSHPAPLYSAYNFQIPSLFHFFSSLFQCFTDSKTKESRIHLIPQAWLRTFCESHCSKRTETQASTFHFRQPRLTFHSFGYLKNLNPIIPILHDTSKLSSSSIHRP